MITTRREVMAGGLAAVAAAAGGVPVWAAEEASAYFAGTAADNGVSYRTTNFRKINKKWQKQVVNYFSSEPQGTVVVDTINHMLYLIMENRTAIRYGVGVGREGFKWYGHATIDARRYGRSGHLRRRCWSEGRSCRPSSRAGRPIIHLARALCIFIATASTQAIACMVRWSRGMLARTPRVAAFA